MFRRNWSGWTFEMIRDVMNLAQIQYRSRLRDRPWSHPALGREIWGVTGSNGTSPVKSRVSGDRWTQHAPAAVSSRAPRFEHCKWNIVQGGNDTWNLKISGMWLKTNKKKGQMNSAAASANWASICSPQLGGREVFPLLKILHCALKDRIAFVVHNKACVVSGVAMPSNKTSDPLKSPYITQ